MSDLVEWLTAQYDMDEQSAVFAADGEPQTRWLVRPGTQDAGFDVTGPGGWSLTEGANFAVSAARHIVRHDPARVLADIAAKRRIVAREIAVDMPKLGAPPYFGPLNDPDSDEPARHPRLVAYLEEHGVQVRDTPVLRDLASVYADRPGYDESWRP